MIVSSTFVMLAFAVAKPCNSKNPLNHLAGYCLDGRASEHKEILDDVGDLQ